MRKSNYILCVLALSLQYEKLCETKPRPLWHLLEEPLVRNGLDMLPHTVLSLHVVTDVPIVVILRLPCGVLTDW